MFGTNISVRYRSNLDTLINRAFDPNVAVNEEIDGMVVDTNEYDI